MADDTWTPPSLEDLQEFAEDLSQGEGNPALTRLYGGEIQDALKQVQDVGLTEELRAELPDLYQAWEEEEFPHEETDDDEWSEGDPDDEPDPEDAPSSELADSD